LALRRAMTFDTLRLCGRRITESKMRHPPAVELDARVEDEIHDTGAEQTNDQQRPRDLDERPNHGVLVE
jgi:hypothetical protein